MHRLCDRWAFVWNLRLTTNMTSSVTRRVVRTGGSCLVKRIVVLGDEPFVVPLLLLLSAPGRLWLASEWLNNKCSTKKTFVWYLGFNIETSQAPSRPIFLFISKRKDPSIVHWMKTLCAELKPLSRPYRHCFVRLLASYRLPQLAKLFANPRYVICFILSVTYLVLDVKKAYTFCKIRVHENTLGINGQMCFSRAPVLFDAICSI